MGIARWHHAGAPLRHRWYLFFAPACIELVVIRRAFVSSRLLSREVRQRGLEYQLRWRPTPHGWLVLSQFWISTASDKETYYYPRSVPRHTLSLLAAHPVAGIDVSLGYYHTGQFYWDADGEYASKYNRLDLRLAKNWKTINGRIEATLVLQSLLGDEFESFGAYLYTQQYFKRRGYLSLKYTFR